MNEDVCVALEWNWGSVGLMGGGGHGNGGSVARMRAKTLTEQNVYLYRGLAFASSLYYNWFRVTQRSFTEAFTCYVLASALVRSSSCILEAALVSHQELSRVVSSSRIRAAALTPTHMWLKIARSCQPRDE